MASKTITRKPSAKAVQQSTKTKAEVDDLDLDFDLEDDKPAKEPVAAKGIAIVHKRNMSGTKEIFTDLYKLGVANVIKYEGWEDPGVEHPDSHPMKFSSWEHTHPFRTYDRKGQKQTMSTPIGGHFHVITWRDNADPEAPPIIESISGPMVMGKKVIKGRKVSVPVPANEYDDHTHDVEYIRSAKIVFSTTNVEAAKVMAFEAAKTAPIPGVREG